MKISGSKYLGLNPGCGPYYMDGWFNTEFDEHAIPAEKHLTDPYKADLYCNFFDLTEYLELQSFDKIYLGHFLEHIYEDKVVEAIQIGMSFVKPGGMFMVVGPDHNKAIDLGITGEFLNQIGEHIDWYEDPNDPRSHKWNSTEARTIEFMKEAGLKNVLPVEENETFRPHWPNAVSAAWQLYIVGTV